MSEGRKATWPKPSEPEYTHEYGDGAVLHRAGDLGRRSEIFPDLNITLTAEKLGVTKSHLSKVLEGVNRPSVELAVKVALMLGKDLNFVVGLYRQ